MTKKVPQDSSISWDSISRVERFLTVRWNNLIALGVGIPVLIYVVVVLSTSALSEFAGFIGMVVMGAVY